MLLTDPAFIKQLEMLFLLTRKVLGGTLKADRKSAILAVTNIWWEPGIKPSRQRQTKLAAELARIARFVDCTTVTYD